MSELSILIVGPPFSIVKSRRYCQGTPSLIHTSRILERMSYLTDLTDDQWAVLEALFTERAAAKRYLGGRPRRLGLRHIMNALLYQARTGCQWRMLPPTFPAWQTVRY